MVKIRRRLIVRVDRQNEVQGRFHVHMASKTPVLSENVTVLTRRMLCNGIFVSIRRFAQLGRRLVTPSSAATARRFVGVQERTLLAAAVTNRKCQLYRGREYPPGGLRSALSRSTPALPPAQCRGRGPTDTSSRFAGTHETLGGAGAKRSPPGTPYPSQQPIKKGANSLLSQLQIRSAGSLTYIELF